MAKHRSGYDILKERVAELENDAAFYKGQYQEVCKERDEWKAKFEGKSSPVFRANEKLSSDLVDTEEKLAFLLEHCPFWVRWMYRKQFEKGGEA